MSTLEIGTYLRLLCRHWIDGYIPDDLNMLARLCRLDAGAMRDAWVMLAGRFPEVEPGKRANRYMRVERERVIKEMERKSIDASKVSRI